MTYTSTLASAKLDETTSLFPSKEMQGIAAQSWLVRYDIRMSAHIGESVLSRPSRRLPTGTTWHVFPTEDCVCRVMTPSIKRLTIKIGRKSARHLASRICDQS